VKVQGLHGGMWKAGGGRFCMLEVALGDAKGAAQGVCLVFAEEQVVYEDGSGYATNVFIGR